MCLVYPVVFPQAPRELLELDIFGLAWIAWTLSFAGMTVHLPSGKGWIFLGLSCGWIGDGGAYFIGSKWGRHKCIPKVADSRQDEMINSMQSSTHKLGKRLQFCKRRF
jgi:CDP-diglyceride synthetase